MLERLYLNRAQLLVSRRYRVAIAALRAATSYLNSEIGKLSATGASGHSLVEQIAAASLRINELQGRLAEARPYDAGATRRDGSPSPTKARKRKR
jgi:hypothetical protein